MKITTETSTYFIDTDAMTVQRVPGDWEVIPEVTRKTLRRDGEVMRLIRLIDEPTLGKSLAMLVDVRQDGIETFRTTTYVTAIEL